MNKGDVLEKIRNGRAEWERLIHSVPKERMNERIMGDWTLKDIIAHMTWGEREMLTLIQSRSMAGASELWNLPTDERNRRMVEDSRSQPADEVIKESRDVSRNLIEEIEQLKDDHFNNPAHFAGMPADWTLWKLLEGNTWGHYPEHIEPIRAWLDAGRSVGT